MIPSKIKLKHGVLLDAPGVYFYYNQSGRLLYIGKASSLKRRVHSYFTKAHEGRIEEMMSEIATIDYIETPTVIEALILEANKIKALRPKYNILQRDDKTFLYLAITNEPFPRPLFIRGHELRGMKREKFLRVFGPYTSGRSLKIALDLIRKVIPWSVCQPPEKTGRRRACFNVQINKCPGVCIGAIRRQDYRKIIRHLILFFEGKRLLLERALDREMKRAARELRFEHAAMYRRRLNALRHIQDVALISREDHEPPFSTGTDRGRINVEGRIEAYDVSNISGTSATGSMVVFKGGKPVKDLYRRFKIKTVVGPNDVAMLEEVVRRRVGRAGRAGKAGKAGRGWELPEIMVIDGGKAHVNRVRRVLDELGVGVPVVGIAKGLDRKQDRLVFDRTDEELVRVATLGKELFQKARDEAHCFAVKYHRTLRSKKSIRGT